MTFIASMWGYRDRVIPVRGKSPEALYEVAKLEIAPDLIFFDSDKKDSDLSIAHELFPNAILSGDDWTWEKEDNYSIRQPVQSFCNQNGYKYTAK